MRRVIVFTFFAAISMTAKSEVQEEKLVLSDGKACRAKVLSSRAIVLPAHCIQNPNEILFEDLGVRKIARIKARPSSVESLVTVEFTDVLFPSPRVLAFAEPVRGPAEVIEGNRHRECKVIAIDAASRTFDHDCAHRDGESGTVILQNGKPVGIHLGTLGSQISIAAMSDGPRFEQNSARFLAYHPQGLKISCCKKLAKAADNLGNAIASGAEALKDLGDKAVESLKGEISRIQEDFRALPKSLSPEYVQQKVSEIKLPKLPEIKIDDAILKQGQFKWELPDLKLPTISIEPSRNSVMGKILSGLEPVINSVDKGLVDFNTAAAKAAFDVGRTVDQAVGYLLQQFTGSGDVRTPDCNTDSKVDQKKDCIADLEAQIAAKELILYSRRAKFGMWLFENKSLPDTK